MVSDVTLNLYSSNRLESLNCQKKALIKIFISLLLKMKRKTFELVLAKQSLRIILHVIFDFRFVFYSKKNEQRESPSVEKYQFLQRIVMEYQAFFKAPRLITSEGLKSALGALGRRFKSCRPYSNLA